jgi:hypothetical protein
MAGMSVGSVCNAKRSLSQRYLVLHSKPLIEIRKEPNRHGGKARDIITVTNIWAENERRYSSSNSLGTDEPRSAGDLGNSRGELASSAGEIKKNTVRKLNEESAPSLSPSSREKLSEISQNQISDLWKFTCSIFNRNYKRLPGKSELRRMKELVPIDQDEFSLIRWWYSLDKRDYYYKEGIGFYLRRRPRSTGMLLQHWSDVCDVARGFLREQQRTGRA